VGAEYLNVVWASFRLEKIKTDLIDVECEDVTCI
jgi:hypothetical protein